MQTMIRDESFIIRGAGTFKVGGRGCRGFYLVIYWGERGGERGGVRIK